MRWRALSLSLWGAGVLLCLASARVADRFSLKTDCVSFADVARAVLFDPAPDWPIQLFASPFPWVLLAGSLGLLLTPMPRVASWVFAFLCCFVATLSLWFSVARGFGDACLFSGESLSEFQLTFLAIAAAYAGAAVARFTALSPHPQC